MAFMWPWPKGTSVNQEFGTNPGGVNPAGGHTGMDGGTPIGTPVYAPANGVIEYAQWFTTDNGSDNPYWITNGGGISVVLGADGNTAPSFIFSHLSSTSMNRGDRVVQGQIIGYTGNTGKWTTGPHLHFEAIPPGFNLNSNTYGRVNPRQYCTIYKNDTVAQKHAVALKANERKVGTANVNQRDVAKTSGKIVRVIAANTTEAFTGYVIGETVNKINIWYKDSKGYAWAGGFTSQSTAGLSNLTPAPVVTLKANQRKTGTSPVNFRKDASTSSPIVKSVAGNSIVTFDGYVLGEKVTIGSVSSNIWYKNSTGFAWSGGFLVQNIAGLTNLTPKPIVPPVTPLKSSERISGDSVVNVRSAAKTTAPIVSSINARTIVPMLGYVIGERVTIGAVSSDIWYKDAKGYSWSGGFNTQVVTGLANLTPVDPVKPTTPPESVYSFTPDFDFVEYIPAHYNNVQDAASNPAKVVFPAKPQKVVIHQFGTLGVDTVNSTINTFKNGNSEVSAHFVVSGKRIIQMVSLKDRAFHAFTVGNDYVGIETDPVQDADTIASTKKLLKALKAKYGYELTPVLHKDIPLCSTNCGAGINLSNYSIVEPSKPETSTPNTKPSEELVDGKEFLMEFTEHFIDEFLKNR